MQIAKLQVFGIALIVSIFAIPLSTHGNIAAVQQRMIEIHEEHADSIVRVKAAYREIREDGTPHVTLRVGTGFFVNGEGYVLVNASRAAQAERVWVEHRDTAYAAVMVGYDRLTNLALLQVLEPPESFGYIPLEVGVPRPRISSLVFALAHALDFDVSPSFGLVTGVENRVGAQIFPTHYIRSTISVDAGEGGAPLLDINGRLIGVTIASIPEINSSYALPVEAVIRVRDDLIANGEMIHSWMGFEISEQPDDSSRNVILSRVLEETPAYSGGLREGDVLLAIGGNPIHSVADVPSTVFFTRANQHTTVTVMRDGEKLDFSVRTIPRPEADPLLIQPDEEDRDELPTGVRPRDMDILRQEPGE